MPVERTVIRRIEPADAEECGRICHEAFRFVAEEHGFPPDFSSAEEATARIATLAEHPLAFGFVAELEGRVVGSNFLHDRLPVGAVGPITVSPDVRDRGVGRRLMEAVLDLARDLAFPSIRLVQAAYNNRSLSLYAKLGFDAREPLTCVQGEPIGEGVPGREVRPAEQGDLVACEELCVRVHGFSRDVDLRQGVQSGRATVVVREARVTGYASTMGFSGHAVAETNEDLEALIAAAPAFIGPGILLPTRNGDVLRWCLAHGLRVVQPMTLMSLGDYREPAGPFIPSISF